MYQLLFESSSNCDILKQHVYYKEFAMDLNVYYHDKKIAEINSQFLSCLEIDPEKIEKLKDLIKNEYELMIKRDKSLKQSGFVSAEIITSLHKTKDALLEFWRMRKEKGLCSLRVFEYKIEDL